MNESRPLTDYSDPRPESKIGRVRTALMHLIEQHRNDGALPTSVRFLFYELVMQRVITKEGTAPPNARAHRTRPTNSAARSNN